MKKTCSSSEEIIIKRLSEKERCILAQNPSLSHNFFKVLANDSHKSVKDALQKNPNLPNEFKRKQE